MKTQRRRPNLEYEQQIADASGNLLTPYQAGILLALRKAGKAITKKELKKLALGLEPEIKYPSKWLGELNELWEEKGLIEIDKSSFPHLHEVNTK